MLFAPLRCMSKNNNVNPNFYKVGGREHTEGADKGELRAPAKESLKKTAKPAKKK